MCNLSPCAGIAQYSLVAIQKNKNIYSCTVKQSDSLSLLALLAEIIHRPVSTALISCCLSLLVDAILRKGFVRLAGIPGEALRFLPSPQQQIMKSWKEPQHDG
eukprot:scaffold156804_cov31-Prasinocladus_malaysianus.AAC.1